jgi:hypothetical protein
MNENSKLITYICLSEKWVELVLGNDPSAGTPAVILTY